VSHRYAGGRVNVTTVPAFAPPTGAVSHLDFLGKRYYAGGAERGITAVLTGTAAVDENGALISTWFPGATGFLLTDIATLINGSGATIVAGFTAPDFSAARTIFNLSADAGANGATASLTMTDGFGKLVDFGSGSATTANAATAATAGKIAVTYVGGSKLAVSVNGGTVVSDTSSIETITSTTSIQLGHASNLLPIGYLRSFTVYAAVADGSLPGLST
jgi:hypothetical protein